MYLHILGSLQMYGIKKSSCYFSLLVKDIPKGSFQSPKQFNVCDADKSTDVYLITEWWAGHYSKISETVKYRESYALFIGIQSLPI